MSELHPGGAEPAGVSHDLCVCGKPAAHVNADPDEADWACRVPVVGVSDEPAKRCTCDPGPEGQHRHWRDLMYGEPAEPVGVSDAPENPELSIPAGVCDEAVEAAREAYRASACALSANGAMRAALEAAVPFLQPTNPQVVASRQAVHQAIADELDGEGVVSYGLAPKLTDRVMAAVRPLPTGEQIAEALHHDNHVLGSARCKQYLNGQLTSCYERTMHDADAVLALMGGTEEETK